MTRMIEGKSRFCCTRLPQEYETHVRREEVADYFLQPFFEQTVFSWI